MYPLLESAFMWSVLVLKITAEMNSDSVLCLDQLNGAVTI